MARSGSEQGPRTLARPILAAILTVFLLLSYPLNLTGEDPGAPVWDDEPKIPVDGGPEGFRSRGTWTSMVYIALDNDLDEYPVDATNMMLRQLLAIPELPGVNLVVFMDGHRSGLDPGLTHVFYITANRPIPIPLRTVNASWTGRDLDSGCPYTLLDFMTFCVDVFPADNYALQMVGHGGGWRGQAWDYTAGSHISNVEFTMVMRRFSGMIGGKLDLLIFAECLMSQLEVLYPLRDYVDIAIGSQQITQPTVGYQTAGGSVFSIRKDQSNEEIAVAVVEATMTLFRSTQVTLQYGAVDLKAIEEVATAVDMLSHAILSDRAFDEAMEAREKVQEFGHWGESRHHAIDLMHYCEILRSMPTTEGIKESATRVIEAVSSAVLISDHYNGPIQAEVGVDLANGIAMYFDLECQKEEYWEQEIARDTRWGWMVDATVDPDSREWILDELGYNEEQRSGERAGIAGAAASLWLLGGLAVFCLAAVVLRVKKMGPWKEG